MVWLALSGAAIWCALLLLPWQPWRNRERLEACAPEAKGLDELTVLIPARNEAPLLPRTLAALRNQGGPLRLLLVDDGSEDDTVDVAQAAWLGLTCQRSGPVPAGWTGKLWALEQGFSSIETPWTLLLDADIELAPGLVAGLLRKRDETKASMLSLMATLPVHTFWERLLHPAFVFFFKLLYPFALSNSKRKIVAAAAGGCILIETRVLKELGGFAPQRGALIDDCVLARRVKRAGHRTWTGLSRSVKSLRSGIRLASIWNTVARTAFVQLRCSWLGLLVCTLLLVTAFLVPPASLFLANRDARALGMLGCAAMGLSYLPTLRFYRLSVAWALALPLVGMLYGAMTWTSALRYARGIKSEWRGRIYHRDREIE